MGFLWPDLEASSGIDEILCSGISGILWPDVEAISGTGGILFLGPGLGVKSGSGCFSVALVSGPS